MINDWQTVRLIKAVHSGNMNKDYYEPLPQFDSLKFPFVMCSGYEHFSLINVLKCKTQVFIIASSPCIGPQQAFFFKEEKYGFSIHFSTCELTDENV